MTAKIEQVKQMLDDSQKIVFFTGAGMSTASGIPDFRSSQGVFMEETGLSVSAEEVLSVDFFESDPRAFFDFYFKKLVYPEAEANSGHFFIRDLEAEGKDVSVLTQNIDGLHEKAGNSKIYNLHGSICHHTCLTCGQTYPLERLIGHLTDGIPLCRKDGGILRPDIVLYGESLDQRVLHGAIKAIQEADMVLILGTSLAVYPAAGLLHYYSGDKLVVINKGSLASNVGADLVFDQTIDSVIHSIKEIRGSSHESK